MRIAGAFLGCQEDRGRDRPLCLPELRRAELWRRPLELVTTFWSFADLEEVLSARGYLYSRGRGRSQHKGRRSMAVSDEGKKSKKLSGTLSGECAAFRPDYSPIHLSSDIIFSSIEFSAPATMGWVPV